MTTQIVYSDDFSKHDSIGHPENAERLKVMMNEVKKSPFYNELEFVKPELLPEEMLFSVHSNEMIQQIKDKSSQGNSWIDMDTYVCESDYETARLAAGGLLQLCKDVLHEKSDNAFALVDLQVIMQPVIDQWGFVFLITWQYLQMKSQRKEKRY